MVAAASAGKPTPLEAIAGAQRLVFTLLRDTIGDAELYLSGYEGGSKSCTVTFDYAVNDTPLRFSDGTHAAYVAIEGQTITSFSSTAAATPSLILPRCCCPIRQAAAIAVNKYLNAELRVCYDERGTDTVGVGWFAD